MLIGVLVEWRMGSREWRAIGADWSVHEYLFVVVTVTGTGSFLVSASGRGWEE